MLARSLPATPCRLSSGTAVPERGAKRVRHSGRSGARCWSPALPKATAGPRVLTTQPATARPQNLALPSIMATRSPCVLTSALAGPRPGVAFVLPSLVETHAVLWGAQSAGYAVPLNFLLNPEHLADLVAQPRPTSWSPWARIRF